MTRIGKVVARVALAVAVVAVAGCAQNGGSGQNSGTAAAPAQGPSPTVVPTAPPPTRPTASATPTGPTASTTPTGPTASTTPTGPVVRDGWVVGTITRGGSGPCYGLRSDDGVGYAMHSTTATGLAEGDRVRVKISPIRARIACGPGHQVKLHAAEPIR